MTEEANKTEKNTSEMSFGDFMRMMCTNPKGRRITTLHIYSDPNGSKEIIESTPMWVEISCHPSLD